MKQKFFTFAEALLKVQANPQYLAMTRAKYQSNGCSSFVEEILPMFGADNPYPMLQMTTVCDESIRTQTYIPTQDDMHSCNWYIIDVSTEMSLPKEVAKPLKKTFDAPKQDVPKEDREEQIIRQLYGLIKLFKDE